MSNFSWKNLDYPIVICPPMDGITDNAYRELIAGMGGAFPIYCEFINVKGLIYENRKTLSELKFTEKQRPIIVQLFGNDPEDFYKAAKIVVEMGFDAIDINMGCPAHKVASKGCGCALMNNTKVAKEIVEATIKGANEAQKQLTQTNSEYEITCKMRLGVNDKDQVFEHGMEMLKSGAKAIAIHGRTLKQMYTGFADWDPIKKFKKEVLKEFQNKEYVPKVFGSGDVKSLLEAFIRILTTNVDGVMIGRGSFGNPWVFEKEKINLLKKYISEIRNYYQKDLLSEEEIENYSNFEQIKNSLQNKNATFEELSQMSIKHTKLMLADKGEKSIVQMRKHYGWYFVNFDGAKELRTKLMTVISLEDLEKTLSSHESRNVLN